MPARSLIRQTLHYFARPHRSVPKVLVEHPAAWDARELRRGEGWREGLSVGEVGEVERAVRHAAGTGKALHALTVADLPLPGLSGRIARWREVLATGRGFVVIRGVPVQRWSEEDAERFFWTFGLHLGVPGAQNPGGDLLGHVRDEGHDDQTEIRAYRTRARIRFHCDASDVVGLLCLQAAARGGRSRIVSSVTVFNALVAQRPDLARRMFEPARFDTKSEGGLRHFPVPLARYAHGQLRTFAHADYFRSVARHHDVPALDDELVELLDMWDQLADEHHLAMDLEPGDIQLLNNHTQAHARDAYEDSDAHRRHLLRLWLSLPEHGGGDVGAWLRLVATLARERVRQAWRA